VNEPRRDLSCTASAATLFLGHLILTFGTYACGLFLSVEKVRAQLAAPLLAGARCVVRCVRRGAMGEHRGIVGRCRHWAPARHRSAAPPATQLRKRSMAGVRAFDPAARERGWDRECVESRELDRGGAELTSSDLRYRGPPEARSCEIRVARQALAPCMATGQSDALTSRPRVAARPGADSRTCLRGGGVAPHYAFRDCPAAFNQVERCRWWRSLGAIWSRIARCRLGTAQDCPRSSRSMRSACALSIREVSQ